MYLAGYAVECSLKVRLMHMFKCAHLAELEKKLATRKRLVNASIYTHQLMALLQLTGAANRMRRDPATWIQFSLVHRWMPAWRYSADLSNEEDAADFLRAVDKILIWIDGNI